MLRNFIITIFSSFLLLTNVNAEKITVFDFTDEEFKTLKVGKKLKVKQHGLLALMKMVILLKLKQKVKVQD